jgi:signal transduction histidine kinase
MGDYRYITFKHISAILLGAFILLGPGFATAQFNKDSLLSAGRHGGDIGKRVDALLLISDHYSSFYQDSAIGYAIEALTLARKYNYIGGEAHAYYALSAVYMNTKNISKARYYLYEGMRFSDRHNYVDGRIEGDMHFSNLCGQLGKNDSMMYYSLNALELAKKTANVEIQAGVAHDIGNIYAQEGNFEKALEYCTQSLNIWTKIGHKNVAGVLSDIGNIYYNKKDLKNALAYYKKSFENANLNNDALAYGYSLNNIGLVYMDLDSNALAIGYFKNSIRYYHLDLNKPGIANAENNLGAAYLKTGNYKLALGHAKISLAFANDQDFKKGIMGANLLIAEAEAKTGHFENAWKAQKLASIYQDTLNSLALNKKIADFETKFEIEKKDNENKLLKARQLEQNAIQLKQNAELKRENQLTIFVAIIMVLCLVIALLAINISRKRKRELKLMANINEKITDQNNKLEISNDVKTRIFSIVSHDFKSPLASLQLFLSLLKGGDLDEKETMHLADELMKRMDITFSFIDNLLGWAQSQLQGYQPMPVEANLSHIVEDSFNLYKKQAQLKEITLYNHISTADYLITDDNMLKLVMRNLVSNALKYTNNGGRVDVSAEKTHDAMIIGVSDSGIGMNVDTQRKLFTMLRINTIGTANEAGTGLGLMLSKEFIEKNGGSIWVKSEPGKGSTFYFSIPTNRS